MAKARIYDVYGTGIGAWTRADLLEAIEPHVQDQHMHPLHKLPDFGERHAAFLLHGRGLVTAGEWFCWGVRLWRKRVNATAKAALTADKLAEVAADTGIPVSEIEATLRRETMEQVEEDLLRRTEPTVKEVVVGLHARRNVIALGACSTAEAEAVLKLTRQVLSAMWGDVHFPPWKVSGHLAETRPSACLPPKQGRLFLLYLLRHLAEQDHRVVKADTELALVKLGRSMRLASDNDAGQKPRVVNHLGPAVSLLVCTLAEQWWGTEPWSAENMDRDLNPVAVELTLELQSGTELVLKLNAHGEIAALKTRPLVEDDLAHVADTPEERAAARALLPTELAWLWIRRLVAHYDATDVQQWTDEAPDGLQFWPGEPEQSQLEWTHRVDLPVPGQGALL